jgi:hypothetical protein
MRGTITEAKKQEIELAKKLKQETKTLQARIASESKQTEFMTKEMKNQMLKEQVLVENMEKCYIFPHEFLYLLCNSEPRLEIIKGKYKVEFKSQKGAVVDWEMQNKKDLSYYKTYIHLLG